MEQSELFQGKHSPPLAKRMAPANLSEFVGQEHLLGPGKPLRKLIETDRIASLILFGPPGCGKSAIAGILAGRTKSELVRLNAVTSTVEDIRQTKREAIGRKAMGAKTILFIDEIHRFNKAQQDALLPDVEDGTFVLVGTTTHNPFFALTSALMSRSRLFTFKPLSRESLLVILKRALEDKERGLGGMKVEAGEDALGALADMADGDARAALNGLELAVMVSSGEGGRIVLTAGTISEALQKKHVRYDRDEDGHYDTISAFIKSVRGSDPDAAIYWLAKMLVAGEDPRFIARRLVILSSEDIGNADPRGLLMATALMSAVETVGLPEARITLAQVTVYLACAPKSNASYMAIDNAMKDVEERPVEEVPVHLRDANYPGAKAFGHGKDYRYPHDSPDGHVKQEYRPGSKRYYIPTNHGVEARFKEYLEKLGMKQ